MYRISPNSISVVAALDDNRDERGCLDLYHRFCEQTGLPLRVITKNSDLYQVIDEFKPNTCIVNGYYRILKPDLLAHFSAGCLGIHGSLLPDYRGGSPLVWSIINGDKESGISLFYFDDGIDTGDVVAQKRFEICDDETISDILAKVQQLSIELIEENFLQILTGTAPRKVQDHSKATYVAMRQPSDGQINWNWSASQVNNFIRAQTAPYPGAYTRLSTSEKLTIWKARRFGKPFHGPPGKIVQVLSNGVVVTCGDGSAIILENVQKEGQGILQAARLLRFNEKLQ